MIRLNKLIAENTEFSRRKADELIETGKVKVNGKVCKELGTKVSPKDSVQVFRRYLKTEKKLYLVLNKPKGYITTRSDELDRKTVMDLIPKGKNLKPVGRLDKDTEGLLLFTNDGDTINRLTHPKFECKKIYEVETKTTISDEIIHKLETGIRIDGRRTQPAKVQSLSPQKLQITIHEGRNRQIRKMFAKLNCPVKYLRRIKVGELILGSLQKGQYRYVDKFS